MTQYPMWRILGAYLKIPILGAGHFSDSKSADLTVIGVRFPSRVPILEPKNKKWLSE